MSISYSSLKKTESLQQILQRSDLWKGRSEPALRSTGISTGYTELDKKLLHKGWPQSGMIELQQELFGHGEWHLLLPSMKLLLAEPGYIFLINPPATPYAPALLQQGIDPRRVVTIAASTKQDWLAAILEILAAHCCIAVCCWEPSKTLFHAELRKLQLAASHCSSLCFLLRKIPAAKARSYSVSSAVLKIKLQSYPQGLRLSINKQRGSYQQGEVLLPWPDYLATSPFLALDRNRHKEVQASNVLRFSGNS